MRNLVIAALLLVTSGLIVQARMETGFLNRTLTIQGVTYKYVVYVPSNYSKSQKWPVVLFLHGAGERGDDGLAQSQVGLGGAIRLHPDRYPAVVVMPQCRKDHRWTEAEMTAMALGALDASIKEFHGEKNRIYLVGLSMGGAGTFAIGANYGARFAAMAPVCGRVGPNPNAQPPQPAPSGDPYAEAARKIGKKPIWMFHGDADPTVPVAESRKMSEAIKAAGGDPKYTEYPGVGHNSWDRAFNDEQFPKWLFAQHL